MYVDPTRSVVLGNARKKMGRVMPARTRDLCISLLQENSTSDNDLVSKFYMEAYESLRIEKGGEYKSKTRPLCYTQLEDIAIACKTQPLTIISKAAGCETSEAKCLSEEEEAFLRSTDAFDKAKMQNLYEALCIRTGCPWIAHDKDGKESLSPSTRLKYGIITKAAYGLLGNYSLLYSEMDEDNENDTGAFIHQLNTCGTLSDATIFDYAQQYHIPLKWIYHISESCSFWGYNPWSENVLCIIMMAHPRFGQFAADYLQVENPMAIQRGGEYNGSC